MNTSVLRISCPDQPGLVAAVSSWVAGVGGNIVHAEQHTDRHDGMFFQRVEFTHGDMVPADSLRAGFSAVAANWAMDYTLEPLPWRPRTAVLCSRQLHCAADLLSRTTYGDLGLDIVGVVSNHADAQQLATSFGHTFFHAPVGDGEAGRAEQENTLSTILDSLHVDLVVLARYMQILSPEFCAFLQGRAINIHHSFLPSFKGAKPYYQAHDRGVKLIGATAHYVTADLDEGPIIEQDVTRVDHSKTVEDLTAMGRDTESQVLA
ncbi:MAG: formyltetrahydrofolate deformylase, partial [Actinomycetota bacterium]